MDQRGLENIPLIDVSAAGRPALLEAARPRADALIALAHRRYGQRLMQVGDAITRAWLARNSTPYRGEVDQLAAHAGAIGAYMLNFNFEWGCTGLVGSDPATGGMRMLRVLDWRLGGLGRHVVVARIETRPGPYYDVTWPGYVGVLTAMAPGRFAAAIHQAPMRRHGCGKIGDWALNRVRVWRREALAPSHLLRHVFETAGDFAAARTALASTPLAVPAIFLLAGVTSGEACVIERLENSAVIHDGPGTCANSWRNAETFAGRWSSRGYRNDERLVCLAPAGDCGLDGFSWVTPPVLNGDTRIAVMANAATGELAVQGYEQMAPATAEFRLTSKGLAVA